MIWSLVLAAVGVFGLWMSGRRNRWGWAVGLGAQVLWVAYALATWQLGFLISAAAYGWVYSKNFLRWSREAKIQPEPIAVTLDPTVVRGFARGGIVRGGAHTFAQGDPYVPKLQANPTSKPMPPSGPSGVSCSHCACGCGEIVK